MAVLRPVQRGVFSRTCGYCATPLRSLRAWGLPDGSHGSWRAVCAPGLDPDGTGVQGGDRRKGTVLVASAAECVRNGCCSPAGCGKGLALWTLPLKINRVCVLI